MQSVMYEEGNIFIKCSLNPTREKYLVDKYLPLSTELKDMQGIFGMISPSAMYEDSVKCINIILFQAKKGNAYLLCCRCLQYYINICIQEDKFYLAIQRKDKVSSCSTQV